ADPDARVEEQAREVDARRARLALEQVVHHRRRRAHVHEEARDRVAREGRHEPGPPAAHRLEDGDGEEVVEGEDLAVEALPGVVDVGAGGIGGPRRSDRIRRVERRGRQEQAAAGEDEEGPTRARHFSFLSFWSFWSRFALLTNFPIRPSSEIALSVKPISDPGFNTSSSAPGSSATNWSPSRPEVTMRASVSTGSLSFGSMSSATRARRSWSRSIAATCPTLTPAIAIGARGRRPPTCSKVA